MVQQQRDASLDSDPNGSIFLSEKSSSNWPESDCIPTYEQLIQRYLTGDWQYAHEVLDLIEMHFPTKIRHALGHITLSLMIGRGGVQKIEHDNDVFATVEIHNELYTLAVARQQALL